MKSQRSQTSKPVAVLISDIHYNINTLPLADAAVRQAIEKAHQLEVNLIIAGDLHDTKANMRGEVVAAMIKTFLTLKTKCFILRGNHDAINEKSEEHSLEFLRYIAGVYLIDKPFYNAGVGYLIPYYHDADILKTYLGSIVPRNTQLIMHQGIQGANTGEYYQDKSAINPEDVAGFRVISGHYHARQTIKLPYGGQWDFIGNPYTLAYGEANDPPKGFQVLYSDGILEFVPTNLRKHVVIEHDINNGNATMPIEDLRQGDLVWIKMRGTKEQLRYYTKADVSDIFDLEGHAFRFDLIPLETKVTKTTESVANITQPKLLDSLITSISNVSDEQKGRIKALWRNL